MCLGKETGVIKCFVYYKRKRHEKYVYHMCYLQRERNEKSDRLRKSVKLCRGYITGIEYPHTVISLMNFKDSAIKEYSLTSNIIIDIRPDLPS